MEDKNEQIILNASDIQNIKSSNFNIHLENDDQFVFYREKHIKYLRKHLYKLPHHSMDYHKITLLYFIVGGLILLKDFNQIDKEQVVKYVIKNACYDKNNKICGFRGGEFTGFSCNPKKVNLNSEENADFNEEDKPHIAATYCALAILRMCDYNTTEQINTLFVNHTCKDNNYEINAQSLFNEESIIKEILKSKKPTGEITAQSFNCESDVRFFYCACVILKLLNKSSEDIAKLLLDDSTNSFLNSIKSYEGGYSMQANGESNAGMTFCAVSSHILLDKKIDTINNLVNWLCMRSTDLGVNGRTNKIPDSCYSFWVVGTLNNLGLIDLFDRDNTISFILNCQSEKGGFSKHLNFDGNEKADILHTFYSLAALSLLNLQSSNEDNTTDNNLLNSFDSILAVGLNN